MSKSAFHQRPVIVLLLVLGILLSPTQATRAANSGPNVLSPAAIACVNFGNIAPGQSVEGLGTVYPNLNINASGTAVAIKDSDSTAPAFGAPNPVANQGPTIINKGVGALGGFVDIDRLHEYSFTFAPGYKVDYFSLKLLDYGDYNPMRATQHSVELVAYNQNNQIVDNHLLSFTSDSGVNPTSGSAGNLQITGDAVTAVEGQPGNFKFEVSGSGITRLALRFSNNVSSNTASDPNIGLAVLCFQPESVSTPQNVCIDFTAVAPGASVEGLGRLHPDLNINSTGNAVSIYEGDSTAVGYGAPNPAANLGSSVPNNGVGPFGGFVDINRLHDYDFAFAPGKTVQQFTVKMLDYGDYNPLQATQHTVKLVAFNASNQVVDTDTLSFTSDNGVTPTTGSAGNLQITGDGLTAAAGQPGNYTFETTGKGITRVEIQFGNNVNQASSDPNIGLAVLCFEPESNNTPTPTATATATPTTTPPPAPQEICLDFNALAPGTSVEGLNKLYNGLNISSSGNVVAIEENEATYAGYGAPNPVANLGPTLPNNGLGPLGGFVDITRAHDYQFTFAPNATVKSFRLKMLDFGDYNPQQATQHRAELVAYNASNQTVATSALSFTSDNGITPTSGSAGNLQLTGDAITAQVGQPGNFNFNVAGAAINRVVLRFSSNVGSTASDPNFALAVLCFTPETTTTPTPTNTPTATPTSTATNTPTATPTNTPTGTPPTGTPTATPTSTPTGTATSTPTATPTSTATSTPTATPTLPPQDYVTCEDIGLATLGYEEWSTHVIDTMDPVTHTYDVPGGATYALINTGWEWTGRPNQHQVTEMHRVDTPFGSTTSRDYGDEELEGITLWYDVLQGPITSSTLSLTIDYAGDGSDRGSHLSRGYVKWCYEPNP